MQKTKLGISVGLFGAIVYFLALTGNYTVMLLLTGYVLLAESNLWLRRATVKALVLMLTFSLLIALIGLIPSLLSFFSGVVNIFGSSIDFSWAHKAETLITLALNLIESILLILLGLKAFHQGTLVLPVIDGLLTKYINTNTQE